MHEHAQQSRSYSAFSTLTDVAQEAYVRYRLLHFTFYVITELLPPLYNVHSRICLCTCSTNPLINGLRALESL